MEALQEKLKSLGFIFPLDWYKSLSRSQVEEVRSWSLLEAIRRRQQLDRPPAILPAVMLAAEKMFPQKG